MAIKNRKDVDIIDILQNYIFIAMLWIYVFHQSILVPASEQSAFLKQIEGNHDFVVGIAILKHSYMHLHVVVIDGKIILIGWEQEFDRSTRALNSHDSKLAFKG